MNIITYTKINPTWAALDAANVADGHYASKPTNGLATKARRLAASAQAALDLFHEEAGPSPEWSAWEAEEFDRLVAARDAALAREEIVKQGLTCDCTMGHCTICDAVSHVTFVEEEM